MTLATLSLDAKSLLARAMRDLRDRLLVDLCAAAESAYRLALRLKQASLAQTHCIRRERLEAWGRRAGDSRV